MPTFAEHIRNRVNDDRVALMFDDQRWTYSEWVAACCARAALFESLRVAGPPHIGVLLDNTPEFTMWLGAAALCGATVVGINPTRRGPELERDVSYTDCQLIVTSNTFGDLLDGLDLGVATTDRVLNVESNEYQSMVEKFAGAGLPDEETAHVTEATQFLLLFTSGTSGAPKAVICSQGRLERIGAIVAQMCALTTDDVSYLSMPLFHSACLFSGWAPTVIAGGATAVRPRFSASEFLPDVRRYRATYFTYVGKPLAYVLAQPESADDANNPLKRGFGNEGSEADIRRFAERFNCPLTDGYGSTEAAVSIGRVPGMPAGSIGVAAPSVKVLNPDTGDECPRAIFDDQGRLLNAEACTGEIVNTEGAQLFEGYWNNEAAQSERVRGAAYWSGDLGYRDEAGFFFFAGRSAEWLRVDGENFAGAPIERILHRFDHVILSAVYGVPDVVAGDQVMAALQFAPGHSFDEVGFGNFIRAQTDLAPKWVPKFVRIVEDFPMTETNKVLKRELVKQRWAVPQLWWRPGKEPDYVPFTELDAARLAAEFAANERSSLLD